MIEAAKKQLTSMKLIDKFELFCYDIFDEAFTLPEKVDCIVLSFTVTAFINSYEMLKKLFSQCSKVLKDDGYMFITDFSYVKIPKDDWWAGMCTSTSDDAWPKEFEVFNFFIEQAPDFPFELFNIPSHTMMKAGLEAGF